jgi:hypothetical protein
MGQRSKDPIIMANKFHTNILLLSGQNVTANSSNVFLNGSPIVGAAGNSVTGISVTGFSSLTGVINFSGLGGLIVSTGVGNFIYFSGGAGGTQGSVLGATGITGISITGGNSITGMFSINAGTNITLNQIGLNTLSISSAGGGSSITNAITGFGTLNYLAKFTSDNSGIINSYAFEKSGVLTSTGINTNYVFSLTGSNLVLGTSSYSTGQSYTGVIYQTGLAINGYQTSFYGTTNMGTFSFNANPGAVTLVELPIISGSGMSGVEQSYSLNAGGQSLLKIYAEYNGISGIQNTRIVLGTGQSDRLYINAGANGIQPASGFYSIPVAQNIFGGTGAYLGNPVGWIDVLISGIARKIPYY